MTTVHELKIRPEYFEAVATGLKTFEIRRADRPFAAGDELVLQEYDPGEEFFTGRELRRLVTYVLEGGAFGLAEGYVALGLEGAPVPHDEVHQALGRQRAFGEELAELSRRVGEELERVRHQRDCLRVSLRELFFAARDARGASRAGGGGRGVLGGRWALVRLEQWRALMETLELLEGEDG